VPWYDVLLYVLTFGVFVYFAFNAHRILEQAWELMAPPTAVGVAALGWLLLLEATRRAGGTAVSWSSRWSRSARPSDRLGVEAHRVGWGRLGAGLLGAAIAPAP
jgi:hypothetical protein